MVYWSYAIVITSWLVVFVFLFTPLNQLIPLIHSLVMIIALALCIVVSIATLARFLIYLQQFNARFQKRKPNAR